MASKMTTCLQGTALISMTHCNNFDREKWESKLLLKTLVDLTRILQLPGRRAVSWSQRKQLISESPTRRKSKVPVITYTGKTKGGGGRRAELFGDP